MGSQYGNGGLRRPKPPERKLRPLPGINEKLYVNRCEDNLIQKSLLVLKGAQGKLKVRCLHFHLDRLNLKSYLCHVCYIQYTGGNASCAISRTTAATIKVRQCGGRRGHTPVQGSIRALTEMTAVLSSICWTHQLISECVLLVKQQKWFFGASIILIS